MAKKSAEAPKKSNCKNCNSDYKIDAVHFFEAVQFEKTNEFFLSTRDINGKKGKEIKINYDLNLIEVKSESDHILIPLQSVRAIYLLSPLKLKQIEGS
tara:strand:+ start:330 stop:623 length:294 start_codon:yes stop_codon:yes gene_type:complete